MTRTSGSSPHTRGTRHKCAHRLSACRFIPAYAGNARRGVFHLPPGPVHPRIRGERGASVPVVGSAGGSSPHTRGTRVEVRARRFMMRFIPAYAGNASTFIRSAIAHPVHPRIRGERYWMGVAFVMRIGSSPHTRGTPPSRSSRPSHRWFIPAYAGNAHGCYTAYCFL